MTIELLAKSFKIETALSVLLRHFTHVMQLHLGANRFRSSI